MASNAQNLSIWWRHHVFGHGGLLEKTSHADVMTCKRFTHYWTFVRGIHQSREFWCLFLYLPEQTDENIRVVNDFQTGDVTVMQCFFVHLLAILLFTLTSVTYQMTLSDWTMSCQPCRHVVVTVSEQSWKYRWAAYKSFDETGKFNVL